VLAKNGYVCQKVVTVGKKWSYVVKSGPVGVAKSGPVVVKKWSYVGKSGPMVVKVVLWCKKWSCVEAKSGPGWSESGPGWSLVAGY